jgi:uncharacterized membrane protein YhfC
VLFVLSGLASTMIEIGAPLALAMFLRQRFQCRWRFWWMGVAVFFLFQGITRIPIVTIIQSIPTFRELMTDPVYLWSNLFVLSFTAGLFEEAGRAIAYRYFVAPADRNWNMAVMYGAGHGGLESIGVGVVVLLTVISYLAVTLLPLESLGVPGESLEQARTVFASMPSWMPFLGAWERLGAILVHLGLSVMVLQAFLRGRIWWWFALVYHTLVNFTSLAVLQLASKAWGVTTAMLLTESVVTFFALAALWLVLQFRDVTTRPGDCNTADEPGSAIDAAEELNRRQQS